MAYFVEKNNIGALIKFLAKDYQVYAPQWVEGQEPHLVRFDPDAEPAGIVLGPYRAAEPAKPFFFRIKEKVAVYGGADPSKDNDSSDKPIALFGLKSCDLAALKMLDSVFKEPEFEDVFYIKNRERNLVITSDCFDAGSACFCTLVDGNPYAEEGFDLNMAALKDGFLIEAGSDRGEEIAKKEAAYFKKAQDSHIAERNALRQEVRAKLAVINKGFRTEPDYNRVTAKNFESRVWADKASTCVECSGCINVCPSCHCFLLYDQKKEGYFRKMKMWDACMRPAYARVAGGANPRKHLYERLRHRLSHKFVYFKERYGMYSCSGCGRCFSGCPGKIDIRDVITSLGAAAKA